MAKTPAEIQKDQHARQRENQRAWRARQKEKPLLERLGYPDLAEQFAEEAARLEAELELALAWAEGLNERIVQAVRSQPEGDRRTRALAALLKNQRRMVKAF